MAFDIDEIIGNSSSGTSSQWLNGYLQGSFRDVKFFISSAENNIGRRIVTHEFPERDTQRHEDLGRKNRVFAFSAYIIGDNYFSHREQLINALEQPGEGKLVHPYRGIFNAVVISANVVEETAAGKLCRFDLQFAESSTVKLTASVLNTTTDIYIKRQSFIDAVKEDFSEVFDLSNSLLNKATAALVAIDSIAQALLVVKSTTAVIPEFKNIINNIRGKLIQIAYDTTDLGNELASAITFGTDSEDTRFTLTPENARLQFEELQTTIEQSKDTTPVYSTDNPSSLLYDYTIKQSLAAMSGLIGIMSFTSKQDAEETRSTMFTLLDEVLFNTNTSDVVYTAIYDMKAAINNDFENRIDSLGELFDYNITDQSMPSLCIVNSIYGSIDKEQEILDRNKIRNPLFITGPQPLKVIINV